MGNRTYNSRAKKASPFGVGLEVGQVLITSPSYGHLDIYVKRDKNRGAVFVCEEDGGRYGVTRGVRDCFPDRGSYNGWGYINQSRLVIFKFLQGDPSNIPDSITVIKTPTGLVAFSVAKTEYPDGAIVAFYARLVKRNPAGQEQREATDVFLPDDKHLPLIARLINAKRLSFPQHNEVLEFFLDAISSMQRLDRRYFELFDSVLVQIASDAGVPTQLQTLARVERSKLSSANSNCQVVAPSVLPQAQHNKKTQNVDSPKITVRRSHKDTVSDVMRVDLQIDD